jgi:hypothetical protein
LKIRFDESVSKRVASAVLAITANRDGYEVSWVRQLHGPATGDPSWIRAFAADGGTAIVSGDPNILQNWPDLIAYTESDLISFWPPKEYQRLKGYGKAALLVRWWPAIVEKIKLSGRGDRWRIPMSWTPDVTKFQAIKDPRIDGPAQANARLPAKIFPFKPTG